MVKRIAQKSITSATVLSVVRCSLAKVMPQRSGTMIENDTSILVIAIGPRQSARYPAYIERHIDAPNNKPKTSVGMWKVNPPTAIRANITSAVNALRALKTLELSECRLNAFVDDDCVTDAITIAK